MWPGHDCAGDQNAKDLALRVPCVCCFKPRFKAAGHPVDLVFQLHKSNSPLEIFKANRCPSQCYILFQRAPKQGGLRVQHESTCSVDIIHGHIAEIDIVIPNDTGGWPIETGEHECQRRLLRVGLHEDCQLFPWSGFYRDVLEERWGVGIGERGFFA